MNARIEIEDVSLRFRIYRNRAPSLKDMVINTLTRRKRPEDVVEFFALKNVSLSFQGGDRVGIIGLNGAGKSTLLKAITGIYPFQQGTISVWGRVTPLIELGAGFDMEISGRENIYLNGAVLGISPRQMAECEAEIIAFSELEDFMDLPVKYYSSGMVSRLAFSVAVMVHPEILIVDEILSVGDAHFVNKATHKMQELFYTSQISLLVSHSLTTIQDLCNKIVIMHHGEVVAQGETKEMIDYYTKTIAV